jgi:hypothetical protein
MLGYQHGLVARYQIAKACEMRDIQSLRAANRHAHAVNGKRIVLADGR